MFTFSSFSSNLFVLLLGFVFGNLFPTFFGEFLGKVATPIFILIALDSFHFFYYSKKRTSLRLNAKSFDRESKFDRRNPMNGLPVSLRKRIGALQGRARLWPNPLSNSLKIGFLFGLFVDAFKVGS